MRKHETKPRPFVLWSIRVPAALDRFVRALAWEARVPRSRMVRRLVKEALLAREGDAPRPGDDMD